MPLTDNHRFFLQLVRLGTGTFDKEPDRLDVDWGELEKLACQQGLFSVMADGIEKLPPSRKPPGELWDQWENVAVLGHEYQYELYRRSIAELAQWYNSHCYKMMVLKGFSCSLDWPKPEHRPCGDIDIWLFGKQAEADKALSREVGIKVDNSHHHHTVFMWRDNVVENHYDFINVHSPKSNRELEKVFKALGADDSHSVELYGEKVYTPSPDLHSLFLVRHMMFHFAAANITLRQVLDWAFLVKRHFNEIDWGWFNTMLEEYHMVDFHNIINQICVEDLGFSPDLFPFTPSDPELKERVLGDILSPEYEAAEPEKLIPRIIYKYKRWQGNAWKQTLCYKESRWSYFCSVLFEKVLKPASI